MGRIRFQLALYRAAGGGERLDRRKTRPRSAGPLFVDENWPSQKARPRRLPEILSLLDSPFEPKGQAARCQRCQLLSKVEVRPPFDRAHLVSTTARRVSP